MAQSLSAKRLRKELLALTRDPVENITARPLESNILVWHYVLKGRSVGVLVCMRYAFMRVFMDGEGGAFIHPSIHLSTKIKTKTKPTQAPRAPPTRAVTTTGSSSSPLNTP